MNVSGQSACFECPAGFVCAAQATAAVPCPGGTFGGNEGLRGFSECKDAPPGFYAQAGSIAPTPCPSWGFCPGRRSDQVNDVPGSIPIVIPEGQQTTNVTKVVEQAINQTVLELPLRVEVADVDAFNDTAVRLRVAGMLGLPLHAVSLSFGPSRRRLHLLTAHLRRLAALDFVVTITDEPGVNITSAARIWKSKSLLSTLSAELGIDVTAAPSPVVALKATVQYVTVSTLVVAQCPAGSWGANGECFPCSKGTYGPGGTNGTGCLECPAGTYQPSLGGSECRVCGAGNYSSNTLSCEPCQVGEYCPEGSVVGKMCPPGSTTEGRGAENLDDCGCPAGTFDAAAEEKISCEPCDDDHMLCARTGLTLATVPLPPSRWRLSVTDRHFEPIAGTLCNASVQITSHVFVMCSARTAPPTSRHATLLATYPLASVALTAQSAPPATMGRAASGAPNPIATTTPILPPAKSAATWSAMLSSSSPCFWRSPSFSLCCALPCSACHACLFGSQAG